MVGLGGGFILVPILRLFLGFSPAYAAGTSLVLIVANSASGAFTYLLQKRVHLKIGLLIAAGGLPGSILGAIASVHISARLFDTILAVLLVAVAVDMAWNAERRMAGRVEHDRATKIKGMSYRAALGLGFIVGIFSSLFGLGGGIVLVPTFLYFSELPAHAISAHVALRDPAHLTGGSRRSRDATRHRRAGRRAAGCRRTARRPNRRTALAAAQITAASDRRRDRAGGRGGFAGLAPALAKTPAPTARKRSPR